MAAVALATSSAWLIDRAAERPGLTALTAAMCLVQFLAFSKAGLRYFERLGTHDLAFRVLGRLRVRFFATLARLAPAGLGGERSGDVLSRSVDDVDRLQNLYLLVLPLSLAGALTVAAAVCVAALLVPRAGAALAVGLLINAVVVPVLAHHVARAPAQRVARARARSPLMWPICSPPRRSLPPAASSPRRSNESKRSTPPCGGRRCRGHGDGGYARLRLSS